MPASVVRNVAEITSIGGRTFRFRTQESTCFNLGQHIGGHDILRPLSVRALLKWEIRVIYGVSKNQVIMIIIVCET